MQRKLLEKLCCPFDKQDLNIRIINEDEQGEIYEGILTCPECHRYFPVIYGIPILTPDEYRQKALEKPVMEKWGFEIAGSNENKFEIPESGNIPRIEE